MNDSEICRPPAALAGIPGSGFLFQGRHRRGQDWDRRSLDERDRRLLSITRRHFGVIRTRTESWSEAYVPPSRSGNGGSSNESTSSGPGSGMTILLFP